MAETLGERRFKELVTIYYHLIKRKEEAYISALSEELGIDEDTLASDIEYLNKKEYIEAKILLGYGGKIADIRGLHLLPKGIDVVENPFNFDSDNIISVNTNVINVNGNSSIQGSSISQFNISNISVTTISKIEEQISHMEELLDNEEFKKTLEESKEELKQGRVVSFKEKIKKAWEVGIQIASGLSKFVALAMSFYNLYSLLKYYK